MNNFNFTVLEGNLVRDPEVKTIGDKTLCKLVIASNRQYTKKDGTKVDEANFFDVAMWGKLGETCSKYLKKGSRVLVSGNLCKDIWKTAEGETKSNTYINAKEVNFLNGGNKL